VDFYGGYKSLITVFPIKSYIWQQNTSASSQFWS